MPDVPNNLLLLTLTAAAVGFVHTLLGPDHYLPFVVLSKSRGWPRRKTAAITLACGVAHVLSSVVLGALGIGLGVTVSSLEAIESSRGDLAAWLLICIGFVYLAWGLRRASEPHRHPERETGAGRASLTPWMLFLVFVLGPCEPLIPVLMYPAALRSFTGVVLATSVFAVATLATMLAVVLLAVAGIEVLPASKLERYSHALAGLAIFLCGLGVRFAGL